MTEEAVPDEQELLHEASAAFTRAKTREDVEAAWQRHVSPWWDSLDAETQDILSRLHALRLQTVSRA
jgi:hypothetical protein